MIPVEAIAIAFLAILLTLIINWYINLGKYKFLEKVPGPKPYPIIGNSNLIGTTTVDLLKSFMNLQEQYGTFYKLWIGPNLTLVMTKPEYLEKLLSSTIHIEKSAGYDLFKPWLGDSILVTTGAKWRSRRKMITPTFHFKILEEFMEVFNYQINIMLDNVSNDLKEDSESTDILHYMNLLSLDIICETAFGTPLRAQAKGNPKYVWAVTAFLEIFTLRLFSAWKRNPILFKFSKQYKTYKECLTTLHDFTRNIIKQRREEYKLKGKRETTEEGVKIRAALLDMLLEASNNGEYLTDEEIRAEVDTFMFEGHDTSSVAMCWLLYALAHNPEVQQKVYEEVQDVLGTDPKCEVTLSQVNDLKYMDIVLKEALRFYPPVPLIERKTSEEFIIDDVKIPKNTTISVFLYGMSRNPEVFPNPDKFDPERFLPEKQSSRHNYSFVPFAAGPRNCIGQKYANYEIKTTIAKFLLKFQVFKDVTFEPQIGMCSVLKSKNGLRIKLKERK